MIRGNEKKQSKGKFKEIVGTTDMPVFPDERLHITLLSRVNMKLGTASGKTLNRKTTIMQI